MGRPTGFKHSKEWIELIRLKALKRKYGEYSLDVLLELSKKRKKDRHKAEYLKNKGRYKRSKSDNTALRRHEALLAYSNGLPQCSCCGELEYEFLTIDHIIPRKSQGHDRRFSGRKLYQWLRRNNYPSGFQVLCMNCNWGKARCGECPHRLMKEPKIPFRDIVKRETIHL